MHTLTIIFAIAALIMIEVYYLHTRRLKELRTIAQSRSGIKPSQSNPQQNFVTPAKRTPNEIKFCELLEKTSEVEWPSQLLVDDEPSMFACFEQKYKAKNDRPAARSSLTQLKDFEYKRLMRLNN